MNTYRITRFSSQVYADVTANNVADAAVKGCMELGADCNEVEIEIVLSNGGTIGTYEEDEFIVFSNEHGDTILEFEHHPDVAYVREPSGNVVGRITEDAGNFKFEPLHQSGYEPINFASKMLIDVEFEMTLMFAKVTEQDPS